MDASESRFVPMCSTGKVFKYILHGSVNGKMDD